MLTSAGSFSRRELSPYSDIDLIFITKSIEQNERKIAELVQLFWDNDLEVSHTVRDFSDIEKFLKTDLHAFTQLFETRLLLGSEIVYSTWNKKLIGTITDDVKTSLLGYMYNDWNFRFNAKKAIEKIGYKITPLREGLTKTIEWYKDFIEKEKDFYPMVKDVLN